MSAMACGSGSGTAPAQPAGSPTTGAPAPTGVVITNAPPKALVWLESAGGAPFPLPEETALLDQSARSFIPELLVVRAGQPIEFRNSEDVVHNVRVDRTKTGAVIFNENPAAFEKFTRTLTIPGEYNVTCDIHPGMRAQILVSATPFAGVADEQGSIRFADVPPGSYTLHIGAGLRSSERKIEVTGPTTTVAL